MSATPEGGMTSVITKKEDVLVNKKYKRFVLIDEETKLVLAKKPVKYEVSEEMPMNYFTVNIPDLLPGVTRAIAIHQIAVQTGGDDYDWVLQHNSEENAIFYSRSNFIAEERSMNWLFVVRDERVLLKNIRSGKFLKIEADGNFSAVDSESKASKWKFIHNF